MSFWFFLNWWYPDNLFCELLLFFELEASGPFVLPVFYIFLIRGPNNFEYWKFFCLWVFFTIFDILWIGDIEAIWYKKLCLSSICFWSIRDSLRPKNWTLKDDENSAFLLLSRSKNNRVIFIDFFSLFGLQLSRLTLNHILLK